jgi:hypothetical protein
MTSLWSDRRLESGRLERVGFESSVFLYVGGFAPEPPRFAPASLWVGIRAPRVFVISLESDVAVGPPPPARRKWGESLGFDSSALRKP